MQAPGRPAVSQEQHEEVTCAVERDVAVLTLNRPRQLNAMTPSMGARLASLLTQVGNDPAVRAVVITGAGRGFCAGADKHLLNQRATDVDSDLTAPAFEPRSLQALPKPVIAAVNGHCLGVGFAIAAMCDLRFASASARFATAYTRRGLAAEDGTSWILPRLVGSSRAFDLLTSGRTFSGEEAERLGFVNRVASDGDVLSLATGYATMLAENCSPRSIAIVKRQLYADLENSFERSVAIARDELSRALRSEDFREGIASLMESRAARFPRLAGNT